ncbi:NADPH:quinone oxidoreductase family protein [Roseitranquillus sediminis]|uniref:NADPH:quinone oxidoreductase family protein n=1 Tax=Roseitranquillus sediminis TaxID=2809051 RepID=UPI001D0CB0A2|nr:NADPH:quinone oxidoreductase family protein [Roseitranquillus sediminis]MBM9595325.1 NADPH:quinone oxidoreductase family protein [Roseitranquillus sediminis]
MRVLQVEATGKAPVLRNIEAPRPGAGELLIEVRACGLNFADLLQIDGVYQERLEPPFVLGRELSGLVAECRDADGFRAGDRVAAHVGSGGLAELAAVPAERCLKLPSSMPFEQAAAFQVTYGTSHLALVRRAQLQSGETLLVLGAAGGVGLTAVEIGRNLGATVIAVARGRERLEVARRAGAHHLLDRDTADVRQAVIEFGGADVVYDPVGGEMFAAALRACRPEARYLLVGFAGGVPEVRPNHLLVKNASVIGHYWGGYLKFRPDVLTGSLRELLDWYERGQIHPHVGTTLPLDRALEGLEMLRRRTSTGKVVILP